MAVQAERAQRINVPAWAGAALAGCGGPLLLAQMQARPLSVRAVTVDTLRPGLADAHAEPAGRRSLTERGHLVHVDRPSGR